MADVTGFGLDISGFNASIKQAEESFNRLKRTGVATAQAINKAFADASNGGIQQMRQSLDNMFGALSKNGGAQKSVEKIGQAVTNVGTQATRSATGIDALIRSIAMGGDAYASLMYKINSSQSGVKNPTIAKIDQDIHESKRKLLELKESIDKLGSGSASKEQTAEITAIKNTIDMLERKRESMVANLKLQERLAVQRNGVGIFGQNTAAKASSDEYVRVYEYTIKEYERAWEAVDKRLAKNKVAEYKATLTEMMSLDKSMYSSDKGGKAGTEDARVVEARYKELTQRKLALENELDQIIARNKENAENKLAQQVENIKKRSDARISAESQRRAVQESNQELAETKRTQKEKLAEYKATLAEMKSLDGKIYAVDTKGNSAERASIEESRRRYEELSARKEAIENELGKKIADIRKRYEAEVQSETAKRLINERNAQEAESKRIQAQKVADYKATIAEMRSLDKSIYQVDSKGTESEKAAIEASRQRYVQLAKDKEALENELGSRVARIRSRYEAQVVSETGKRIVSERLAKEAEAKRELNEARRVAREKAAEERRAMQEKIANYKATLAEMKTLDRNIYQVDTRGNSAEIAAMSESKARYAQLNKDKEAMEQELGSKVVRIRNRFEAEVQSEAGRRAVQTRIQKENEAKREANEAKRIAREKAAEERRIEQEKLREYRSIRSQMLSLDNDMYLVRKKGTTPEDAARLDELKRREQELNRERARLSQELGDKKARIDREYDNRYLAQVAKRYVREREISSNETKQLKREVRREYEQLLKDTDGILKKMRNAEKLGGKTSSDPTVRNAYAEYDRQLNAYDAKRKALESQFQAWVADLQAKNTTKKLDEDINAIRKRQAEEQAAAAAKAKADSAARQQQYQSYVTSYDGAMRVSNKVLERQLSENEHIKAIEHLTAARKKLNESDANYKKQVEELNKAIQKHEEFLARASRTTDQNTEAARRNAEQQRRRQEQIDRGPKNPADLLATDTTGMTLRQLQNHAASLKATMSNLVPKSDDWNKLNVALQQTNRQINGIRREMGILGQESNKTSSIISKLGRVFSAAFVFQKLSSFAKQVVTVTGEFEQMHVAMRSIVGDLESANRIWDQTIALSKNSPFKAVELVKYTRQLAAYRIETDKLHDTTKMLADVSAGLAVDMSRLILAYGQVRAAEYLRGTELRQFTEAGVPMLEELAKHFSELEGRAYSTAEVFDMISKRQVAFADVSAVLENMTSEGGPFYKMQEQMANTIKGSISTLKNEVDLMMHDIGKSNSGLIKFVLNTLKFLVKHWREVAGVLTFVIALLGTYQVTATASAIITGGLTTATNLLSVAMVNLGTAIKGVWTSLGPVGWLIAGVSAAALAMLSYFSGGEDKAKEKAEELKSELEEIDNQYKEINESIEKNKLSFEDAFATNNISEMRVQLTRLAEIAKEKYSMVIEVQLDGATEDDIKKMYDDLTKELYAKQMFSKKFQEKFEEKDPYRENSALFSKHDKLTKQWEDEYSKIQSHVKQLLALGNETYSSLFHEFNPEEDNPIQYMLEYYEGLREIKKELAESGVDAGGTQIETYNVSEIQMYQSFIDAYLKDIKTAMGSSWDFTGANLTAALASLLERNEIPEDAIELWKDSMKRVFELGDDEISLVAKDSLSQWEQDFNTYLEGLRKTTLDEITKNGLNEKEIGDRLRISGIVVAAIEKDNKKSRPELAKALKEMRDIQKAIVDAVAAGSKAYTEAEAQVAQIKFDQYDAAIKWLEGNQGDGGNGKNKLEEANKKRIDLLKKMNSQYLSEFKTFGEEAEPEIRAAYEKAFGEVFKGTKIKLEGVDFTSKTGMVEALEKLRPYAKKAGKDAVDALETEIAKFKGEIKIEARKDLFQETLDDVDELFDKYELSLEIKKLNIPPDLAKSLFGEDFITLDELKVKTQQEFVGDVEDADKAKALTDELNKGLAGIDWNIVEAILGTDQMKELKQRLEKIDDIEDKAAKERMKTYSKYLVEGMNDRVKLKIEEMRKLKEIEESPEFNPEQKEQIKKQVSKEAREEQDKQEWEAFKGTDMYTMMFDDLELLGTKALDILQKKLEDLKGSLSDLPASEVKEIVQQISKIEDVTIAKGNPFKYMREEIKGKDGEIAKFEKETGTDFKKESEFQTDLLNAQAAEEEAQRIIDAINLVKNAQLEHGADKGLELVKATDEETYNLYMKQVEAAQKQNQTLEQVLKTQEGIVESSKKAAANASRGINIHQRSKKALQEQANTWSEYESKASEAFAVTKELMTTLGADTDGVAMSLVESSESLVMLTFQAIQFGIQMQIAGYQANMALGVIGWILIAVQAIATVLSAIFSAKDKALQKEIDGHLARAEKLHEKYEELSDAIDSAYDASVVRQLNKEIEKTIQLEIKAIEAAIAAEKSQKDSKIDWGWVDEQEKKVKELYNTLNEEHDNYIARWGGFGSDDARLDFIESMTQAWLDSFKETGDGLAGLEEKWDEYFDNLALKQMTLRVSKAAIDKYLDMWDKYVSAESAGGEDLTEAEAQDLRLKKEQLLKDLSERYTNLAESLGITPTTEGGGLSALQKGISSLSESTGQVLESLLNSMRLYVADTNMHIKDQTDYIKKMWKMMDDSVNGTSAFYVQMKNI